MIRFPTINYDVRIHPKPRGNWRPRVDLYLCISAGRGDCLWRPYLSTVTFLKIDGEYESKLMKYTNIDGVEVFKTHEPFEVEEGIAAIEGAFHPFWEQTLKAGTVVIPMSDYVYAEPENGRGYYIRAVVLPFETHVCEGTEIKIQGSFYLPWRPGAKPDYSDYAKIFSIVPRLLYELLQNGLDSGTSREYRIRFGGRLGIVERKPEKTTDNEVVFV